MKIPVDVWLRGTDVAHTTSVDDAVKVFTLMTEGMSVRATERATASAATPFAS